MRQETRAAVHIQLHRAAFFPAASVYFPNNRIYRFHLLLVTYSQSRKRRFHFSASDLTFERDESTYISERKPTSLLKPGNFGKRFGCRLSFCRNLISTLTEPISQPFD